MILRVRLERVAYDGGRFFVGKARLDGMLRTIKGPTPNGEAPRPGSDLELEGEWEDSERFGNQFAFTKIGVATPADREGVVGFLEELPCVGAVTAAALWERHGENAIAALLTNPEKALAGIKGIGKATVEKIGVAVRAEAETASLKQTLHSYGIGPGRQKRIREHFESRGLDVARVVARNPYRLVEVSGVSFRMVDDGAMKTGRFAMDSPFRAGAAVVFALEEAANEGHTWRTLAEVERDLARLKLATPIPPDAVDAGIGEAVKDESVVRVERMTGLALARVRSDEEYNVKRLSGLIETNGENK